MRIQQVRVRNFSCIADATLTCETLTALVGPNSCGKSSFLRALNLFFGTPSRPSEEDFYARDTSVEISVEVVFGALSAFEKDAFAGYVHGDTLRVVRAFSHTAGRASARTEGFRLRHPAFATLRTLPAVEAGKQYATLKAQPAYKDLPPASNTQSRLAAIEAWEAQHPEECELVGEESARLEALLLGGSNDVRSTRYIFVPAIRNAGDDATDGRNSVLADLMNVAARKTLSESPQFRSLQDRFRSDYSELMRDRGRRVLEALERDLSSSFQRYAPQASLRLSWLDDSNLTLPLPRALIRVNEDGHSAPIDRTGHGIQRAFVLTILQHLIEPAQADKHETHEGDRTEKGSETDAQTIILAIEEPELFQHPGRQRYLAKLFRDISAESIGSSSISIQVIYCTHSPLFVGIDRFHQVRSVRKVSNGEGRPMVTTVTHVTGDEVAEELSRADSHIKGTNENFTWAGTAARLRSVMTPMVNEGFFADVAVLVEGEEDRAIVLGAAEYLGYDLESLGISVIPCHGKGSMDKLLVIFRRLGVPVYVIWDGDAGQRGRSKESSALVNKRLLFLLGQEPVDWPTTRISDKFAVFENNLTRELKSWIGTPLYQEILNEAVEEFSLHDRDDAAKNPSAIAYILDKAKTKGVQVTQLEEIAAHLCSMRSANRPLSSEEDLPNLQRSYGSAPER